MQQELVEIYQKLKKILKKYENPLEPKLDLDSRYDLWSIKDVIIDGRTKKEVFFEISKDWTPSSVIVDKFGDKGQQALEYFDHMKLAETKWTTPDEGINGKPQKMYRSFYSLFNINISCPVNEISEIFTISALDDNRFKKLEEQIYDFIGENGTFGNKVSENFQLSNTALKALVKRSNKFHYTGLKIMRK